MSTLEPLTRHIHLSQAPNLLLMMMILGCASTTLQRGDALLVPCCSFVGAADHSSRCHVRTTPAISNYQSVGLQRPLDTFTPVKLHAGSRPRPSAPLHLLPKHMDSYTYLTGSFTIERRFSDNSGGLALSALPAVRTKPATAWQHKRLWL